MLGDLRFCETTVTVVASCDVRQWHTDSTTPVAQLAAATMQHPVQGMMVQWFDGTCTWLQYLRSLSARNSTCSHAPANPGSLCTTVGGRSLSSLTHCSNHVGSPPRHSLNAFKMSYTRFCSTIIVSQLVRTVLWKGLVLTPRAIPQHNGGWCAVPTLSQDDPLYCAEQCAVSTCTYASFGNGNFAF